eukprot:TRINITY_DN14035_c0_g1_i1.p1 TRINITY_DN14035_c0_g1~~TRINITY_DN14035_c0_g1_i1.p1  ORF type:complete len:237 (-),score=35.46 TRINITY_DN14035_c0_g1_i1:70-750(-)
MTMIACIQPSYNSSIMEFEQYLQKARSNVTIFNDAEIDVEMVASFSPNSFDNVVEEETVDCSRSDSGLQNFDYNVDDALLTKAVSAILRDWIAGKPACNNSIFSGLASVGINDFIAALLVLLKKFSSNETVLLVALIYINRIRCVNRIPVTETTIFRLLLASTVIAIKFCEDECPSNQYFAEAVGMETRDINKLEFEIIRTLNFELHISEQEFNGACDSLRAYASV